MDKAESNAGNAELNVDQQAANPVDPHPAEPPKADETKPNNDAG